MQDALDDASSKLDEAASDLSDLETATSDALQDLLP